MPLPRFLGIVCSRTVQLVNRPVVHDPRLLVSPLRTSLLRSPTQLIKVPEQLPQAASLPFGMTARDAEDPLARSAHLCRIFPAARLSSSQPRERLDQAVHTFSRLEQDGAAVGTPVFLVERGDEGLVEQIRETEQSVVSCEASRRGPRCGATSVDTTFLPHGGPCVSPRINTFTHNPG